MSVGPQRFAIGSVVSFGLALGMLVALALMARVLGWVGLPLGAVVAVVGGLGLLICAIRAQGVRDDGGPDMLGRSAILGVEGLGGFGLVGIVAMVTVAGHDGLSVLLGLTGGFALGVMLIAPRLSGIASRSMPDFLSLRHGSDSVRYAVLAVMIVATVLVVTIQMMVAGLAARYGLGIAPVGGVLIAALGIAVLSLGRTRPGMAVLSVVALVGLLLVCGALLAAKTGIAVPHVAWGGLLEDIRVAEDRLGLEAQFGRPGERLGTGGVALLALGLGVGASVMPQFIRTAWVEGQPQVSRRIMARGMVLFVIVATALPGLGVLFWTDVLGLFLVGEGLIAFDAMPEVMRDGTLVCGAAVDAMRAACDAVGYDDGIAAEWLAVDPQRALFMLPILSGASGWVVALLSLSALCVVLVAGAGAITSLTAGVTSRMPPDDAMRWRRGIVGVTVLAGATVALVTALDVVTLGAWTLSLVGSALFAPLVLSLWWPRAGRSGVMAGILGGFAVTLLYLIGATWGDGWSWFGVPPLAAGVFGIVASFALVGIGSLFGAPPKAEQVALLETMDSGGFRAGPEEPG